MDNRIKPCDEVIEITTTLKIKKSRIGDLLCSAFEGGSNYWYRIEEFIKPKIVKCYSASSYETDPKPYRHIDWPLSYGGALVVSDALAVDGEDVRVTRIDMPKLLKGLEIFHTKYPRHYNDWIEENDDAATGDVFLQCCCFGEIIYG